MSGGALFLVDRCEVQRWNRKMQAYGGGKTYASHLTSVPCRFVTKTQNAQSAITGEWTKLTTYKVMVLPDADIEEGDRIVNVVLQGATVADSHQYEVDGGALPHRGRMARHKTLTLKKVS